MPKKAVETHLPDGLLEAIGGEAYLLKRPSFVRVSQRALKAGHKLTREQYRLLCMPVRDAKTAIRLSKVNLDEMEVTGQVVNYWTTGESQVKVHFRAKGPEKPELRPAEPIRYALTVSKPKVRPEVMSIPDIHFGFADVGKGDMLEPLHDERAVALYLRIAQEYQPATIVILGDLLDLAPFSRFVVDPRYRGVTQAAIQHAYAFLSHLRAACPTAKIVMLEGNHEHRIAKKLAEYLPEVSGLTRGVNEGVTELPVLSIQNLLRLDDLRIEYFGPYGARFYHNGTLYLHGEITGPAPMVLLKLLQKHRRNVVCGHTHHAGILWETAHDEEGPRDFYALMCGTAARRDGIVPAATSHPEWQHAFALEWFGGQPSVYVIRDGVVSVDGKLFTAEIIDE